MTYNLLGTAGCHLCEIAEALIQDCKPVIGNVPIHAIDIADEPHWQADFASLIPVLLHLESGQFLNWPFSRKIF